MTQPRSVGLLPGRRPFKMLNPQKPWNTPKPTLPVLDGRDRVSGWWPGLPRSCPHCGGRLFIEAPMGDGDPQRSMADGRVSCLFGCARDVALISPKGWIG